MTSAAGRCSCSSASSPRCGSGRRSGKGQVVDAAMVDGSSVLSQMMWSFRATGMWSDERGVNMLDTGAPYYDTYETRRRQVRRRRRDRAAVLRAAAARARPGCRRPARPERHGPLAEELRATFTEAFAAHDRDHWAKVFDGTDACVTPVLSFARGGDRTAHHRARHLLTATRRQPGARARAAVLPQRAADADAARRAGRRHRSRPARLGIVPTNQ